MLKEREASAGGAGCGEGARRWWGRRRGRVELTPWSAVLVRSKLGGWKVHSGAGTTLDHILLINCRKHVGYS